MIHDRYHRQRLLPVVGDAGQERLRSASVAVVGMGALGCVSADQLVRAGVGRLVLIDRDVVELTNLQRQPLYTEADAAGSVPKVAAAARRLQEVNSTVCLEPHAADLTARNATAMLADCDVIIDGTDNFETRYLLNDVAVRGGVHYVYGGAVATRGMVMRLAGRREAPRPCLRCVFPHPPALGSQPTCDTAGVLGAASGIAASLQAAIAIGAIVSDGGSSDRAVGSSSAGESGFTLIEIDAWTLAIRKMNITRDSACPCCVERKFEFLEGSADGESVRLCGTATYQVWPRRTGLSAEEGVDLERLGSKLRTALGSPVEVTAMLLRCTLPEGTEMLLFTDGRALLRGAGREETARALYAKYVGS